MRFDYSDLRGRMVGKYGSQAEFASVFGISENSLSLKMNNKTRFSSDDIVKISELLDIDKGEIGKIFFTIKV